MYLIIVNLEVWSSADWDAEHPAGTSLNDLARFSSNTPWPYIQSGYTQKYHEQLNGEYYPVDKLISELTPDDMTLLPRGGVFSVCHPAGAARKAYAFRAPDSR